MSYNKSFRAIEMAKAESYGSVENKFVDTAAAVRACDTTGSVTLLNTIAQGVTTSTRIGKKVVLKSVQFRGRIYVNTATTHTDVTVILVYDRSPVGSAIAITDVLASISSLAQNNDANSGRFRILRRWDYVLTGNSTTPTTGNEAKNFDEFVPLGLPTVYKAVGDGAIADQEYGSLYMLTLGNVGAGTAAASSEISARLRFTDKE